MEEVTNFLLEQSKVDSEQVMIAAERMYKTVLPVAKVSASSLAASMKIALSITSGLKDVAVDGVNIVRQKKDEKRSADEEKSKDGNESKNKNKRRSENKPDKHRHIVAPFSGNTYDSIHDAANKRGQNLESIKVADKKMLGFETIARKYKIKYGLRKNKDTSPPTWDVYFMAKDKTTMKNAFKEFTNRQLSGKRETPLEIIGRMTSRVNDHIKPEKVMKRGSHQL